MLLLTANEVLTRGFRVYEGLPNNYDEGLTEKASATFRKYYGSNPTTIAYVWHDIMTDEDICQGLSDAERFEKGFKQFLIAIHFLWAYPKNADMLATRFGVSLRQVQGENLWKWVRRIAALKKKKIVWPTAEYEDPLSQVFIVSVDGVDFKCWEAKDPLFPYDKAMYSHKHNNAALKYEIAIDIYRSKVVWISGPHKASIHDKTIYDGGLRDKIPANKKIIVDRVYGSRAEPDEQATLCVPNACDSKNLRNFKSRVRARHESFNGRLRHFKALSDTFHHAKSKHVHVFESICVMVQYQMDLGAPLFDP